jgi:hypothetical protein
MPILEVILAEAKTDIPSEGGAEEMLEPAEESKSPRHTTGA